MAEPVDLFLAYNFLKRLVTPFDQTQAFKLGLIDAHGVRLRKAKTDQEKLATGYFDRLIFNLKRLLAKIPGGESRIATLAAALLLLREEEDWKLTEDFDYLTIEYLKMVNEVDLFDLERLDEFIERLNEDGAIANVTAGASVDPTTWRPKIGPKRVGRPKTYGQMMQWRSRKIMEE